MVKDISIFKKELLSERLSKIPPAGRAAFAAACAQRLAPLYARYKMLTGKGRLKFLEETLDKLWAHLQEIHFPVAERSQCVKKLGKLLTDEDDGMDGGYADDALLAAIYAVNCSMGGEKLYAVRSSKYAFEVCYSYVLSRGDIDYHLPNSTQLIYSDPIAQAELARQQRDLDEITAACQEPGGLLALIPTLRARAIAEAITFE